jgi:hypothetical protein
MQKPMNMKEFFEKLNDLGKIYFKRIQSLIYESQSEVVETLFVSQPYYYLPMYETIKPHYRPSVMLTFFKDHVNIFAHANKKFELQLREYKLTEKHTLQIFYDQPLHDALLIVLFKASLHSQEDQ